MKIGVPTEIKTRERRVSVTPDGARELVRGGHKLFVQSGAGAAVGFSDSMYQTAGCEIVPTAEETFDVADMIVKVKEPQPIEIGWLKPSHTLFTYLHLAPDPVQTRGLMESGATCIAYETVTDRFGRLPLLTPMSEVAGRLSIQAGVRYLETLEGNTGLLLGGVTGVAPANVVVIGGGVSGRNAAQMAIGLGARVSVFDLSTDRLRELDIALDGRADCLFSTTSALDAALAAADLVVGAVLVPGATAPKVVSAHQVSQMKTGAVMVDISIDQGGCFETSRTTTHDDPVYTVDGVIHYCVANMPALVARTATQALSNATLPFIQALAGYGPEDAMQRDPNLAAGLNVRSGRICHPEVANTLIAAA